MLTNSQQLHVRAKRCRELAETAVTEEGRSILCEIAQRYEQEASTEDEPRRRRVLSEAAA